MNAGSNDPNDVELETALVRRVADHVFPFISYFLTG
jgi:hypothetical protein